MFYLLPLRFNFVLLSTTDRYCSDYPPDAVLILILSLEEKEQRERLRQTTIKFLSDFFSGTLGLVLSNEEVSQKMSLPSSKFLCFEKTLTEKTLLSHNKNSDSTTDK